MNRLLFVSGLHKSFVSATGMPVRVLRGVSFEARAGEMIAVTGASGAGKSTLLHLLGGLEAADEGTVSLSDFEVTGARASALNRYRALSLGFVFQFHHLLPDLTAIENVAMPLLINRKSKSQSKEAARQLLDEVGLADQADQAVNTLSGGEQQRVAVARSLITRPILVLADEPTGNLDASIGVEIEAILLRYARQNNGCVLLATHNERLAARCDRRFLLRNGILDEITV